MRSSERVPPRDDAPSEPLSARIVVCSSCREADGSDARPRPGERLAAAAAEAAAGTGVRVSAVECLGNCRRRLSAAVLSHTGWSYVFGDLTEDAGPDLVLGARLLSEAADGIMPWRGRPDCLKRGLVARTPPASILDET